MTIGARNQITGSQMESVITVDRVEDLGLKKGDNVRVIAKAIHVLPVKE